MMKRNARRLRFTVVAILFASAVLISPEPATAGGAGSPFPRIEICHREGTPAEKVLHVSPFAAAGHYLAHGDSLGECGSIFD